MTGHDLSSLAQTIIAQKPTYRTRFLLPLHDRFATLRADEILFFASAHKQTSAHTRTGKSYYLTLTLDQLEHELDPTRFFRANRQYIVSADALEAIHTYFNGKLKVAVRGSDEVIVVSKEKAGKFKSWLDR
jgi:DNA-binding LytR/AlgR family response regulator